MKYLKFLGWLFLTAALWIDCKDSLTTIENDSTVSFSGHILDENNQPIIGAAVQAGDQSATTDAEGAFHLASAKVPANDARLSVRKTGYFAFSRAYIVESKAQQAVTIQLIKKEQLGSFIASQGGTLQIGGGGTLQFPANSIALANSGAFLGTVNVYARHLDPADPNLLLYMPGDLRGINAGGEERALVTFGMIAVELVGAAGEELQVAAGSEVEMSMPIGTAQLAAAPASVPLWYYDLDKARWIEEGTAQKVGDQYVGKVKHFSYWNYDASYPSVLLHGKVFINDDQHPLSGAVVWVGPADQVLGAGYGHGTTDDQGNYGGSVPAGILLRVTVLIPGSDSLCGDITAYEQIIGSFNNDAILPPITIMGNAQLQTAMLSGRLLDCNGQALTNGFARITVGSNIEWAVPDAQGFIHVNFNYCSLGATSGTITAYEPANLHKSPTQTFALPPTTVEVGDITTCETLTEYIQYTLDGQTHVRVEPWLKVENNYIQMFSIDHQSFFLMNIIGDSIGTFPIGSFYTNIDTAIDASHISATITSLGASGQPVTGTFDGLFQVGNGPIRSITGNYHAIRK